MKSRLHVLLGDGGVGKTTLAAAYALALAARGHKVALLGIDPARRLQGALGLSLGDVAVRVPLSTPGELHAALLAPEATLRRWATEGLRDERDRERLLRNRFFTALADRLATTTDVIAAVRIAEWIEAENDLTDFVVDTAPGRNGLEFLTRPAALVELMQGRAVRWLREPRGVAGRVVRGLAHIGGSEVLGELGELASFFEEPFRRVLDRLERANAWVHDSATEVLVVTAVRDGASLQARATCAALLENGLSPGAVIVNRVLPPALGEQLARADVHELGDEARAIVRYALAYAELQERVAHDVAELAPTVVRVAAVSGLDERGRLEALAAVGQDLCAKLDAAR